MIDVSVDADCQNGPAIVYTAISRKVVGKLSASDNPAAVVDGFECTVLQRNLNE